MGAIRDGDDDPLRRLRRQWASWRRGSSRGLAIRWTTVPFLLMTFAVVALGLSFVLRGEELEVGRPLINVALGFLPALILRASFGRNSPLEYGLAGIAILVLGHVVHVVWPHPPWSFLGSVWRMSLTAGLCLITAAASSVVCVIADAGRDQMALPLMLLLASYAVTYLLTAVWIFTPDDDEFWLHLCVFILPFLVVTTGLPQTD